MHLQPKGAMHHRLLTSLEVFRDADYLVQDLPGGKILSPSLKGGPLGWVW